MSHENPTIVATTREVVGKKVKRLRKQGVVPAVLYGYNVQPTNLQVDAKDFELTYRRVGRTTLVDLSIDNGRPVQVFVHDIQRDPLTEIPKHIDFHAVNLRVEINAEVPIVLVGESPAVNSNTGLLLRGHETVTVHARPADLPHQIDVSIEGLTEVDQVIHVSDLTTTGNYQILTAPEEMVVKIGMPQVEADLAAEAAAEETPEDEAAETSDDTSDNPAE